MKFYHIVSTRKHPILKDRIEINEFIGPRWLQLSYEFFFFFWFGGSFNQF